MLLAETPLKVLGCALGTSAHCALTAVGPAYTAGVVATVVGPAGALLALRAGGEQFGWGFQLQSTSFIVALAVPFPSTS